MQGLWERVELLGRTPEDPGMLRRAVAFSPAGPRGGVARADFYINFITLAAMLGTDQGAQGRGRTPVRESLASNTPVTVPTSGGARRA